MATYYVSPSGSDSNDGSELSPFATLYKAKDVADVGDRVSVEAEDGVHELLQKNADGNLTLAS